MVEYLTKTRQEGEGIRKKESGNQLEQTNMGRTEGMKEMSGG